MQVKEFAGIRSFHDGIAVSDYVNMIPLDNSCIDRYGEKLTSARIGIMPGERIIQSFVDSKRNVYIATNKRVRRFAWNGLRWNIEPLRSAWSTGADAGFIDADIRDIREVTFCESATIPSQVFVCDGKYVYYWNTEDLLPSAVISQLTETEYQLRVRHYVMNLLPIGEFTDYHRTNAYNIEWADSTPGSESGYGYGWWPPMYNGTWDPLRTNYVGNLVDIATITWYENRLVCTQRNKNTVRLSVIRPDRWIIPSWVDSLGKYVPYQIYREDNSYAFMPHAYVSTASSAVLQDVVAFAGQLYFLNDTSIEIWTNTFTEDAPIQHNTMSTLHYGGRSPCIVADTMYLICKDAYHNDFIGAISQGGAIQNISNDEVDRRLMGKAAIIRPLTVRDSSLIVVYNYDENGRPDFSTGLSITKTGKWWTYENRYVANHDFAVWSVLCSSGRQYDISVYGELIEQNPDSRLHIDGTPILRYIRGLFTQLPGRVIVREVEVVCDTGVSYDLQRGRMYLRMSLDRGMTFGQYLYRSLGSPGKNDRRIIWRNCGSGNSFLIEFGTCDNVRFQLYEIDFNLQ